MKKIFSLVSLSLLFLNDPAMAQHKLWTLEECIQHAIDNNIELKQRELEQENRAVLLNTSKNSWLPNLNGGVGQNFSFGRSLVDDNTYADVNTSYSSVSLRLNMPVFDGFYIKNEIAGRQLDLLAAVESLNKAKEDLAINVTYYYLQVLYNKEILRIATLQVGLTNEQVTRTEALVNAGKVPLSQLYDIRAQLAKDEVTLAEASNNVNLSLLDLAQALELERVEETFDIRTPDTEDAIGKYLGSILPPDDVYDYAVTFKPQIKEQEYLVESQKKALKVAQSGYYPKLDLSASYGTNYYYYYGDDLSAANRSFSEQVRNNQNKTIGFSLSVPLFNRFQVRNNVRSARLAILNQQLVMDNTKKVLYKEIQQAYYNAVASQEKYRATEKSVLATREAYGYAEERYDAGKSTVFEYNDAKTKYAQSLSEQSQAKFDFILRAKILDFYNGVAIHL